MIDSCAVSVVLCESRRRMSGRLPTSAFSALKAMACVLPRKSVQLPWVPHVEVVGQVPQRLHVYLFFGPRCACQASSASSRAWTPLVRCE